MTLKIVLLILVGLLNLVVALAVFSRNVRKPMNVWFFILAAACAGWVFGIAGFIMSHDHSVALAWARFYYVMPLLVGVASAAFALTFPSGGSAWRPRIFVLIGAFLVLSGFLVFDHDFLLLGLVDHPWGKEVVLNKIPYWIYSLYLIVTFYLTLKPIYEKTIKERGLYRSQATVFFDGYLISCMLGVFFNLILPGIGNYQLIWLGPIASNFYVVATAYGIIRHRLFDVRIVAARAVGYLLSVSVLIGAYTALTYGAITFLLGEQETSNSERALSALLAVLLALSFRPMKRFFDRFTNRLFYRDAYDPQAYIDRLNHSLVSSIELQVLLANALKVVGETLKAEKLSFVICKKADQPTTTIGNHKDVTPKLLRAIHASIEDAERKIIVTDYLETHHKSQQFILQEAGVAIVGVIGTDRDGSNSEGVIGYMLLGSKKSGYPYSSQDKRVLELTVNELVIAIQNALRFEEIENFNATLQQKVDEATHKLRRTNEKLRTLDETKDDFISMASHQLRTPLTSVKGYVSMVLDGDAGKITPLQRKLLNQSFISSQRMVYLISDLLNVSRLRTGKFIIEPVPCNLGAIIQEEVEQLVETAKGRDLGLSYEKPAHFPDLLLDETKTRQVIMNFIDNAIYYTPAGGHIIVRLVDKPNAVEFMVVDDGIGVPRAEQRHLFSKFYRAPNAKRARPDGTGLGLFMAKKVVIAQGGAVLFTSKEGEGSTFGFTFQKEGKLIDTTTPGTIE